MLDSAIKEQLKGLFAQLDAHYTFDIFVHPRHESRAELVDLLEEVASCSEKLSCRLQESEGLKFILSLNPQLHSRSATYKRNGLLIRKTAIKSSRPFQCAYYPLTP
ncbi:hypothetical protein HMPREF1534_03263 [Phocaeicola massiliensis B84634 = Timone 84634 = DSM 17679 = JCM 13223]|uniref:Uncharacterized protein n=1 Tax=Phocaeicola massiliensis B84634 = Timone 84634 = DSM 17679 = JCM 13223 TaxID=1121098 RepID=U6R852_9BACT|nr:hypothetical protein HMPREF1534_03263 [Phocaeicola massiliensis B84634 = Timone 84634 = DSM 17679 = JCM 13223]MDQ7676796.1 alkyl hydroperoxide reductase subunit F [Phocaeicola massiliensis]